MPTRQLTVLVAAILQFVMPFLPGLIPGFQRVGLSVNPVPPPEQPAGYAFGIWFVIFVLALVYAVRQALPSQRDNPVYVSIGWPTAIAFGAGAVWMVLAQTIGNGWYLVAAIWAMLAASAVGLVHLLALRTGWDMFERRVTQPMLGLLTGWLTAAAWLNTSSYARLLTGGNLGFTANDLALVVLGAIVATALLGLILTRLNRYFVFALVWALFAVGVQNAFIAETGSLEVAVMAFTLAAMGTLSITVKTSREVAGRKPRARRA
ncbi:MAG: hypothetical protein ACFCUN_11230 [Hyphomicrobiaceae bacterium]